MAARGPTDDAEKLRSRALARWEGEGGALDPGASLSELEQRILRRLGAAVLGEWNDLPTSIQRAIFMRASAPPMTGDGDWLKGEIARFLHIHKDHQEPDEEPSQ